MRALLHQEAVLRVRIADDTGTLVAVDNATSVTCTVKNPLGAVIASTAAATADGTGVYKFTLPPQSALDELTATWTAVVGGYTRTITDDVILVEQRLVDAWLLREDDKLAAASPELLHRAMDTIEDWVDDVLRYPCVARSARPSWWVRGGGQYHDVGTVTGLPVGAGAPRLLVPGISHPLEVFALTQAGSVVSVDDLALIAANGGGALEWADGRPWSPGYYTMWLSHGLDRTPEDLRRAAVVLAREVIRASNLPARAASVTTDASTIVFAMPAPDRPTGIPTVDAVLSRYRDGVVI